MCLEVKKRSKIAIFIESLKLPFFKISQLQVDKKYYFIDRLHPLLVTVLENYAGDVVMIEGFETLCAQTIADLSKAD